MFNGAVFLGVRDTEVKDGASVPEEFSMIREMNVPDAIMNIM